MISTWLNEPPVWHAEANRLDVTTGPGTDFWRRTHYGFVRDDGHLWGPVTGGDGSVGATFEGDYRDQYDQAGVMVRVDASTWIKAGIEHVDGVRRASVVVTRGFSDWSIAPVQTADAAVAFRLTRRAETVTVEHLVDGAWTMLRLAYLPPDRPARFGVMCASPDGAGFDVRFRDITIREGRHADG